MPTDDDRIRRLTAEYEALKERQEKLLDELKDVQQRLGDIMLQIIDVTRE